jgi:hypothetical protein
MDDKTQHQIEDYGYAVLIAAFALAAIILLVVFGAFALIG